MAEGGTREFCVRDVYIKRDNKEKSDEKEAQFFPISKSIRKVHVVCDDILNSGSDCIVNPCVIRKFGSIEGRGDLFQYLKLKGGQKYEDVLMKAKIDPETQCAFTEGGDTDVNIIHPTIPVYNDKDKEENIFRNMLSAFQMAEKERMISIAFPFAYSGTAGVDLKVCAFQYARAVTEFCRISQNPLVLADIYFVEENSDKVILLVQYFKELLPRSMTEMLNIPKSYDEVVFKQARVPPDNDCVAGRTTSEVAIMSGNPIQKEDKYNDGAHHSDHHSRNSNTDPIYETVRNETMPIREESHEFSSTKERKDSLDCNKNTKIKVLEDDIRGAAAHIIVCPEYKGKPHGGVFSLSVKFVYWKAVKFTSLRKVNAERRVARSICHKNEEYKPVRFLYHVFTPIWHTNSNHTDLQNCIESIFLKLDRFQNQERSVAIPLLGVVDVEDQDVVRECCRVFVQSVIKCCRKRNSSLPLDVYLVNSCPTLTSWIAEDLKTFIMNCYMLYILSNTTNTLGFIFKLYRKFEKLMIFVYFSFLDRFLKEMAEGGTWVFCERDVSITRDNNKKSEANDAQFFPISKSKRKVQVVCNDILETSSDCIVNPCVMRKSGSIEGRGKLFQYLKSKGGQKYEDNLMKAKIDPETQCAFTEGGDTDVNIIHPTIPVHNDKDKEENIFRNMLSALQMAEKERMMSIAFPFAYSGIAGVDLEICAFQYARAVTEFCRISQNPFTLVDIYFVEVNSKRVTLLVNYFTKILPRSMTEMLNIPKPYDEDVLKPARVQPDNDCVAGRLPSEVMFKSRRVQSDNDCVAGRLPSEVMFKSRRVQSDNDCVAGRMPGEVMFNSRSLIQEVDNYYDDAHNSYHRRSRNSNTDPIYKTVRNETMPIREKRNRLSRTKERKDTLDCNRKTKIKVLEDDIRVAAAHIIVCPEYKDKPHGGLFGLSVKFAYWKAVKFTSLRKVNVEGRVARSFCDKYQEYKPVRFLYHVFTPIWNTNSNNTDLQKSIESIFLKLNRFQDQERSIAIPLLGVVDVEDQDVVRECCRVFVQSVIKCCRERKSSLPLDVYLVNSCPTLTSWITEDLVTFSGCSV
ncbi:uncharacterized protein LOC128210743 [Mya arenaria]|uniref:uncharacterized protein LOC128210743 n=1 Tax=Mya arenaria TaxID=6604 RepID=UPI0022E4E41A|nr:uncharacterized protein LOC128210743 [Mya arenaria]